MDKRVRRIVKLSKKLTKNKEVIKTVSNLVKGLIDLVDIPNPEVDPMGAIGFRLTIDPGDSLILVCSEDTIFIYTEIESFPPFLDKDRIPTMVDLIEGRRERNVELMKLAEHQTSMLEDFDEFLREENKK